MPNLLDQHFEEALQEMPQKKLSFWANRRVKKMLKQRYYELEGRPFWLIFLPRLVAVPVALMLVITSTVAYGFYSPTIIQSDWLYRVKERGEIWLYPTDKDPEERISYHLWLSDRRYDEVKEILRRKTGQSIVFVPRAKAHDTGDDHHEENGDPLDAILQSTLQRAAENVETAFVIAEEIRELPRIAVVKEKIKIAVTQQQQWIMKAKPVLAQVQLKKSQIERRKRLSAIREQAKQRSVQSATSTAPVDFVSQPSVSETPHPLLPPLPFPFLPIPSLPILLPEPPPTTDTLLEETIAFQQALLAHMEQAINVAEERQEQRVKIAFEELIEPLRKDHQSEVLEIAMERHDLEKEKIAEEEDEEEEENLETIIAKIAVPAPLVPLLEPVEIQTVAEGTGSDAAGQSPLSLPLPPETFVQPEPVAKEERKEEKPEKKDEKDERKKEERVEIVVTEEEPPEEPEESEEAEEREVAELVSEPEAALGEISEGSAELEKLQIPGKKKEKDECEKKAEKQCEKSDQKDCQEKVVKECREEKEKKKKEQKDPREPRDPKDPKDQEKR